MLSFRSYFLLKERKCVYNQLVYDRADAYHPIYKKFVLVDVPTLHKLVKNRPTFKVKLSEIWGGEESSPGFSEERIANADISFPIILDTYTEGDGFEGGLVDGRHRKIKMMRVGKIYADVVYITAADIEIAAISTTTINERMFYV
jgi:hypothetical protein